jgi:intracellular sulfur oxidation DsrE/DsrF family protein
MKRYLLPLALTLVCCAALLAQAPPYKVVFDLTSRDSVDQKAVLRWIKEISTAPTPAQEIEVVMYGKGFELVMPDKSNYAADAQEAIKHPNVSFKVCQIAMKNNKIEKSQLMQGVDTVPDGIREVMLKQREGWGYIKVSH